jgi:RNA polymerase sigma-70 factor (ECF subfamily)
MKMTEHHEEVRRMDERTWLAERFEEKRGHLRAVAYRMLGSPGEAEDAVQEAWLRLNRSDVSSVENLGGWLTTVLARVCLDLLRSRKARREESLEVQTTEPIAGRGEGDDPEHDVLLADSVGLALLTVLETLAPAERVAFVLHDMFDLTFDEIAPIVGRTAVASRQLASRARRRVQHAGTASEGDRQRQQAVVEAFLAASRDGDFEALLAVLDPDVVLRSDAAAVQASVTNRAAGAPELERAARGAAVVAGTFSGRARAAQLVLIDGAAGAVWAPDGQPRAAFIFTFAAGKIAAIELIADPAHLAQLDIAFLDR